MCDYSYDGEISDYEISGQLEMELYRIGYLEPLPRYSLKYEPVEISQPLTNHFIIHKPTSPETATIDIKGVVNLLFQLNITNQNLPSAFDFNTTAVYSIEKKGSRLTSPFAQFKMSIPNPDPNRDETYKFKVYLPYLSNESVKVVLTTQTNKKLIKNYFWVQSSKYSWSLVTYNGYKSSIVLARYERTKFMQLNFYGAINYLTTHLNNVEESMLSIALCLVLFRSILIKKDPCISN